MLQLERNSDVLGCAPLGAGKGWIIHQGDVSTGEVGGVGGYSSGGAVWVGDILGSKDGGAAINRVNGNLWFCHACAARVYRNRIPENKSNLAEGVVALGVQCLANVGGGIAQ